jgi:hypothetical protein
VTFKPLLVQVTVLYGKSLEGQSENFSNFFAGLVQAGLPWRRRIPEL